MSPLGDRLLIKPQEEEKVWHHHLVMMIDLTVTLAACSACKSLRKHSLHSEFSSRIQGVTIAGICVRQQRHGHDNLFCDCRQPKVDCFSALARQSLSKKLS